ncbi:hypothetical protein AUP68_01574 [Ilyonectria robusta]
MSSLVVSAFCSAPFSLSPTWSAQGPLPLFHTHRCPLLTPNRKLGDHTYLSWNNAPGAKSGPSTATASGRELRPGEA